MTVIAWDGETLAVDSIETFSNKVRHVNKIHEHNNIYMTATGTVSEIRKLIRWFEDGAHVSDFPTTPDKSVLYTVDPKNGLTKYCNDPHPDVIGWESWASGAGGEYATSAMYCGKNAIEAVKVAIDLSPNCGGEIKSIRIKPFNQET